MKIALIALLFVASSAHAYCIGSPAVCQNGFQGYGQQYQPPVNQWGQMREEAQPVSNQWNQPYMQQQVPVNQNGFDRYGHYHANTSY